MTLLDDARRMAEYAPSVDERGVFWCGYCHESENAHAPDCPWLQMPRIVAALEAVERFVAAGQPNGEGVYCARCGRMLGSCTEDCLWQALVAALRGEKVTA